MDTDRLVYMANQIARNFAAQGDAKAAELTAQHIRDFWPSAMRAELARADPTVLSDIARSALQRLG